MNTIDKIKAAIRDVPDFPKPGIVFKDITPVLADPKLFGAAVNIFVDRHNKRPPTKVAAVDARGFIFGAAVAYRLGVGFVPIRKKGKLPYTTREATYDLEYGTATIAVHTDAFSPRDTVLLIDDLLATGGTAAAAAGLVGASGATLLGIEFLVELSFLGGREKLAPHPVFAAIIY